MAIDDLRANFSQCIDLINALDDEGFAPVAILALIVARLEQEAARRVA
jgi:hypothetical protein